MVRLNKLIHSRPEEEQDEVAISPATHVLIVVDVNWEVLKFLYREQNESRCVVVTGDVVEETDLEREQQIWFDSIEDI